MTIAVVTPSTGVEELERCILSVHMQSVPCRHIVIADGFHFYEQVKKRVDCIAHGWSNPPEVTWVPDNTNSWAQGRWYGHRIYAFYSQLIDAEYISLLDQDNEYEPHHIEALQEISRKSGFSWSYRSIWSDQGLIGNDIKESIGIDAGLGYELIDTSSWMFRRDHVHLLNAINGQWGADRQLTGAMLKYFGKEKILQACTGMHSLRYYVESRRLEFFESLCF